MIIQYETELSDRPLMNSDLKTNFTLKAQGPKILFFCNSLQRFPTELLKTTLSLYLSHTRKIRG